MYEKNHVREIENPKYGGSQKSYIWKGGIKIIFMKKKCIRHSRLNRHLTHTKPHPNRHPSLQSDKSPPHPPKIIPKIPKKPKNMATITTKKELWSCS